MTDTKLDPATLTAEERAIFDKVAVGLFSFQPGGGGTAEGAFRLAADFILARRAIFAAPEEKAEAQKARAVCPNCNERIDYSDQHLHKDDMPHVPAFYTCQPAPSAWHGPQSIGALTGNTPPAPVAGEPDGLPPAEVGQEPAAPEMPEAVWNAICDLNDWADAYSGDLLPREIKYTRDVAAALESWWRAHSKPVAVGMTEELRTVIDFAADTCGMSPVESWRESKLKEMRPLIQKVRKQAAQPRRMELGKVREGIEKLAKASRNSHWLDLCKSILAELDAVEGRK